MKRELQGTYLGSQLDGNNIAVYGWMEGSGTASSSGISNEPMAWNDRANRVLLQQAFFRVEKAINPAENGIIQWGFRSDWIARHGDYCLHAAAMRHLERPARQQQHQPADRRPHPEPLRRGPGRVPHGEAYIPFGNPAIAAQGLDIKVGRWYAPYGEESIEAVSTPLVSRSYTFNNGPEFTNTGILATLDRSTLSGPKSGGYAIGNDNFFDAGDDGPLRRLRRSGRSPAVRRRPYGRNTLSRWPPPWAAASSTRAHRPSCPSAGRRRLHRVQHPAVARRPAATTSTSWTCSTPTPSTRC